MSDIYLIVSTVIINHRSSNVAIASLYSGIEGKP